MFLQLRPVRYQIGESVTLRRHTETRGKVRTRRRNCVRAGRKATNRGKKMKKKTTSTETFTYSTLDIYFGKPIVRVGRVERPNYVAEHRTSTFSA